MLQFFTLKPSAFGLDISDFSLKVSYLTKKQDTFALASFGEVALPQGVMERGEIKNEEEFAKRVKEAVKTVRGEALRAKYVIASLPEEKAFFQLIQLPPMKTEQIAKAIRFEAENYIPYSLDSVYLDFQVVPPFHDHVDHVDILLAALPRATVDAYLAAIQRAGFIPIVFEIESLATSRALVKRGAAPFPLLLVDFGGTKTSCIIFSGYSLKFTASIPISSQHFTQAISKALGIDQGKAEELKIQHGLVSQDSQGSKIFEALIPSLTDLIEQIKNYMEYYESHAPHQHLDDGGRSIRQVLLCGGGARLKGLREFLAKELKTEVRLGNPWVNILSDPLDKLPSLSLSESLKYTTALGLALRSYDQSSS